MRIGQKSFIIFISKVLGALLGALATVYFARILGAEIYGFYASTLALIAWLSLGGRFGFSNAVKKRVSEGTDQNAHICAGIVIIGLFGLVVSAFILFFGDYIDRYIGTEVALFVLCFVLFKLADTIVTSTLEGQRLVHISGILDPIRTGSRSLVQILLVFAGFELVGMFVGYGFGYVIAILVGIVFVSIRLERPTRKHFRSLYDYAKFSWLGSFKTRTYRDVDILVLTAFVSASLVGIYAIAWSITKVLMLFGKAIRSAVFPEISGADSRDDREHVKTLTTDALAYGGFIFIPGLIGGVLISDRLLQIYGPEFVQGATVLGILLFASLLYEYQQQLMNVLNAVDRPDLSFRINAVFIVTNVVANVALVLTIGWIGAAIATAFSVAVGLTLAVVSLRRILSFEIPYDEISRQLAAALLMGIVIMVGRYGIEVTGVFERNVLIVLLLVTVGAGVYFVCLLAISSRFRGTVASNSPVDIPFLV